MCERSFSEPYFRRKIPRGSTSGGTLCPEDITIHRRIHTARESLRLLVDLLAGRPAGAGTPPWLPVRARRRRAPGQHHPARLSAVIDQFAVETNPRYRRNAQGHGETYCNIFAWDVTRALGAEIPHWVTPAGDPARPGAGAETTANAAIDWLRSHGPRHGWRPAALPDALAHALRGAPAIAAWQNSDGPGHLAVLRPAPATADGPLIASAGETNHRSIPAAHVFRTAWQQDTLEYFVHD